MLVLITTNLKIMKTYDSGQFEPHSGHMPLYPWYFGSKIIYAFLEPQLSHFNVDLLTFVFEITLILISVNIIAN